MDRSIINDTIDWSACFFHLGVSYMHNLQMRVRHLLTSALCKFTRWRGWIFHNGPIGLGAEREEGGSIHWGHQ